MTPDEFVLNLIRTTVTTARVAEVIARIAGDRIEVGPLHFGPGGTVSASGVGLIGPIHVTPVFAYGLASQQLNSLGFDATIPGQLTIDLTAGSSGRPHHYEGTVIVPLHIRVLLSAPTCLVLDVAPLRADDVTVRLRTTGVATFVLQTLGDADGEVAAQVAAVVNDRVEAVADLRRIDLAALLDRSWDTELLSVPSLASGAGRARGGPDGRGRSGPDGPQREDLRP